MRPLKKREWVAVTIAVVVTAILFFGGTIWNIFFGSKSNEQVTIESQTSTNITTSTQDMKNTSTIPGIEIYDSVAGTGTEAVKGKNVTVHYVGTFSDGSKFDSSLDRGQPFTFQLGAGMVIQGWDLGVAGMKVGGTRQLVISPELGYGANDYGPIPGGSTLIFQVQLLDVK